GVEVGGSFFDPTMAVAPGGPPPPFSDAHLALSFELPVFHARGPLVARARRAAGQSALEARVALTRLAADLAGAFAALRAADARALRGTVVAAPDHDAVVAPQVPGRLLRVVVREGDAVASGAVVAEVESQLARDALVQAQAQLAQAEAQARNAGLILARAEHL